MTRVRHASLILTVLNEAEGLPAFLAGLGRQTALPAEIVIVDGGSTDSTVELLRGWTPPESCLLVIEELSGAGISKGRNRAFELATYEFVLVTDGGTELDPHWVERMLDAFESAPSPDIVSGFFRPVGSTLLERAIAYTVTPALREIDPDGFLPSSRSLGIRKSAWQRVGGYPEWLDYCEDLVFDLELKRNGFRFAFVPDAVVTWSARSTVQSFMKQYYRYARGDGKAGLWRRRHAVRYATYSGGLVFAGVGVVQPWVFGLLGAGFLVYMSKFWGRVTRRRDTFGPGWLRALLLVPVIVVAGDLAKMAGYPAGLLWRLRADRGSE